MVDLNELRKIAENATPGPWTEFHENGTPGEYEAFNCPPATGAMLLNYAPMEQRAKDSRFIATFDPPTVLALIDRLEQAERDLVVVRESQKKIAKQFAAMGTEKGKAEWRAREAEQAVARVRELALESQAEMFQMNMPNIPTLSGEILRALDGEH